MKTLSLITALVLGTFVVGVAQNSVRIKSVDEQVAVWSTGRPANVQIFIKDADNNVIHKESFDREVTIAKRFNLIGLERGSYTMEIEDDEYIRTYPLTKGKDVSIDKEAAQIVRTPVLTQRGASVFIMTPGFPTQTSISIFDSKNDLVYTKFVDKKEKKIQMLDLSKIDGGDYKISIVSNGRTFNHFISVD